MLNKDEMQDLGSRINLPIFLDAEPELFHEAVTLRYDEYEFFKQPDWEKKVVLSETLKKWLQTQV